MLLEKEKMGAQGNVCHLEEPSDGSRKRNEIERVLVLCEDKRRGNQSAAVKLSPESVDFV